MNTPTNPEESPQFVFFVVYYSDNVKFYSSPLDPLTPPLI